MERDRDRGDGGADRTPGIAGAEEASGSLAEVRREIWELVREINDAWVGGRPEELGELFHEEMVIAAPDFRPLASGREPCVRSYADFVGRAEVTGFREYDPEIVVWGATALAAYAFDIEYEMDGKSLRDTGKDVFILTRSGGSWLAVWRTQIAAE